jgi:hypothetical protein
LNGGSIRGRILTSSRFLFDPDTNEDAVAVGASGGVDAGMLFELMIESRLVQ